ncbi:MAG: DUF4386 domain-containing protein [Acidimicrobiia bacterium]|nr:DUF4386 domain-containing protein [Acidimicrobiia bacterium]
MKYFRTPAQQIGWLFVLATAAGVLSVVVMASTLGDEDLLEAVEANQTSLLLGEMLIFVMLAAMIGTAVLLWPILRGRSETLALSYVLARTLEVVTIAIGVVAGLLLVPLSWSAATADGAGLAGADVLAETLKTATDWTGYLGAQMVFSISALVLNWAFLRYRLIPRWLSVWGLVGVPLMFLSGLLVMFESLNSNASALNVLVVPLAVQEMVMAIWLIVKGFSDVADAVPRSEVPEPLTA